MVDECERLYDNGEIAAECEDKLKTVIEQLTVLVNNKSKEYGCYETGMCDHTYGEDDYVQETDDTYYEGGLHERVLCETGLHDQVHCEGGLQEPGHHEQQTDESVVNLGQGM